MSTTRTRGNGVVLSPPQSGRRGQVHAALQSVHADALDRQHAADGSDLQPLILQIELALESMHHLVGDLATIAQPHELLALRVEHRADHLLVPACAVLVVLTVDGVARA